MWLSRKKIADQVWFHRGVVYCLFAATGRRGVLVGLPPVATFSVSEDGQDFALMADDLQIDLFANRDAAKQALDLVTQSLKGAAVGEGFRRRLRYVGGPALALFLGLALAGAAKSPVGRPGALGAPPPVIPGLYSAPSTANYEDLLREVNGAQAPLAMAGAGQSQQQKPPEPLPEKLSLGDVKSQHLIQIGRGAPVLYVFGDPSCPACKGLDATLQQMKVSYAVIPVALLGEDAAVRSARVMCAKDQAKAWTKEMNGEDTQLETLDRKELAGCAQKVIDNMKAFRQFGLSVTPSVVSAATGRVAIPQNQQDVERLIKGK